GLPARRVGWRGDDIKTVGKRGGRDVRREIGDVQCRQATVAEGGESTSDITHRTSHMAPRLKVRSPDPMVLPESGFRWCRGARWAGCPWWWDARGLRWMADPFALGRGRPTAAARCSGRSRPGVDAHQENSNATKCME